MVTVAAHQQRRVDIACIHKVLGRQQPLVGQAFVDVGRARHVRLHRRAGHDMCNQGCGILVAGFAHVRIPPRY